MSHQRQVALEVCISYTKRINAKTTGRKMLEDLSEKIADILKCNVRDVKIALLKLHVFNAPTPNSRIAARLRDLSKSEKQDLWIASMNTPFNIEGIRYSEGLREEIKYANAQMITDKIDELSNSFRQNPI